MRYNFLRTILQIHGLSEEEIDEKIISIELDPMEYQKCLKQLEEEVEEYRRKTSEEY